MRILEKITSEILKYQKTKYPFERKPQIIEYLESLPYKDEKEIHSESLLCEKKDKNKWIQTHLQKEFFFPSFFFRFMKSVFWNRRHEKKEGGKNFEVSYSLEKNKKV